MFIFEYIFCVMSHGELINLVLGQSWDFVPTFIVHSVSECLF